MKRRLVSLLLMGCLVAGLLVGCGNSDKKDTTDSSSVNSGNEAKDDGKVQEITWMF